MQPSTLPAWRGAVGGLLIAAVAHVFLVWGLTVGGVGRLVVVFGVYPALSLVGLASVGLGIGRPVQLRAHRERVSRAVLALAILAMGTASLVGVAQEPSPGRAFHVARWSLPAVALVVAWFYVE